LHECRAQSTHGAVHKRHKHREVRAPVVGVRVADGQERDDQQRCDHAPEQYENALGRNCCISMHSLILSTDAHNTTSAFDLDASLLSKLNVKRSEHEQRNELGMYEHIKEQEHIRALQRYIKLCEQLNLSALSSSSFAIIVTLCSRFVYDVKTDAAEMQAMFQLQSEIDTQRLQDDTRHDELALRSNQDWQILLEYFDVAHDAAAPIAQIPILDVIVSAFKDAHICTSTLRMDKYDFAVRVVLNMSPTGVTAGKMVENFIAKTLRHAEAQVPHDLELRVMRGLTAFHDAKFSTSALLASLKTIASAMAPKQDFLKKIDEIMAQQEILNARQESTVRGRPRLSTIAGQLHTEHKAYHGTFESWVSLQRFSLNTSQRMQRFLYFCRVQVDGVPAEAITQQVIAAVWERASDSVVDQIDPTPIIHTIRMVRQYNENVKTLIDFRVRCLSGLTTTVRAQLTLANVLQLYIAAFQHESVRERCWRAVTNSWNFTIKSGVERFIEKNKFEIETVVRTLLRSIGN